MALQKLLLQKYTLLNRLNVLITQNDKLVDFSAYIGIDAGASTTSVLDRMASYPL
jgi:hypothetical protein